MKIQIKIRCPAQSVKSAQYIHSGEEATVDVDGSREMVKLIMDAVVAKAEECQLDVS